MRLRVVHSGCNLSIGSSDRCRIVVWLLDMPNFQAGFCTYGSQRNFMVQKDVQQLKPDKVLVTIKTEIFNINFVTLRV